jgi:hypothetical protein
MFYTLLLCLSYLSRGLFSVHYFSPSTRSSMSIRILQIHSSSFTRVCRKEVKFFLLFLVMTDRSHKRVFVGDISPMFCQLKRKSKRRKCDIHPNNLACTSIPDKTSHKIDAVHDIRHMGLCVCVLLHCTSVKHWHLNNGEETFYTLLQERMKEFL